VFRFPTVGALLVGAMGLAACGSSGGSSSGASNSGQQAAGTDLTVVVAAPDVVRKRIRCPGAPQCARLAGVQVSDFNRAKGAGTQIYGGNWQATVAGTLNGHPVAANFNLSNGCEIARWQRFAWLLGRRAQTPGTG
jgi:hypothetical protein